jgi:hypothetical protein
MIGTPPPDKAKEDEHGEDNRDLGMRRCFDEALLRKFIVFHAM